MRIDAAGALEKLDDARSFDHLFEAMKNKSIEIVAGAYPFYIRQGIPGSEALLIQALYTYGALVPSMARDFLNSDRELLVKAVQEWVRLHDYSIDPSPRPGGPRWGR